MIKKLKGHVNNVQLVVFRVLLGLVLAAEGFGAILTGWVKNVFVDTKFTFTFFGFEWLKILHGYPMYFVFLGLGICGILIALGYRYKLACLGYGVLWSTAYFGQKTEYNNHYYLILLLAFMSILIPAHKRFSLDVKQGRVKEEGRAPFYLVYFFVFQFAIVYVFGAFNKIYPDWLDGTFIRNSFANHWLNEYPFVQMLFSSAVFIYLISYVAIFYDALIIPLLCWRKTRKIGFIASIFFHMFNSIVYQVGVFPYLSLSVLVFFVSIEYLEKIIGKVEWAKNQKTHNYLLPSIFVVYFFVQLILPIRHFFIKGNVFYTEEGHRMSWRMMLRSKSGRVKFYIEENGKRKFYPIYDLVSKGQELVIAQYPDITYQMAKVIQSMCEKEGRDVKVFVTSKVSLNRRREKLLIQKDVDLASAERNYFGHSSWVNSYDFTE